MRSPRALACPHCGGTVSPPASTRRVECRFCGRAHYYAGEEFLPALAFRPAVAEEYLRETVQRLFRSPYLPRDFAKRALLLDSRRSYIPYYLFTGKRGGLLTGGRERVMTRMVPAGIDLSQPEGPFGAGRPSRARQRVETFREEDARVVLGDFRYLYPGASLGGWSIADEALRQEVLSRLDEAEPAIPGDLARGAEVVDPDLPMEHLVEKGVAAREATGNLEVLDLQAAVVYVPVRTLTFRFEGALFTLRLDELGSRPLGGRLPFRRDWSYLLGVPLVAGMGWFTGLALKILGLMPASEWLRAALTPPVAMAFGFFALLAAAVLTAGLTAAWGLMRRPYGVGVTPEGLRVELVGEGHPSPIAPLTDLLWRLIEGFLVGAGRRS